MAAIYSSAPMPLYDIHRNDFVNQDYQVPITDGFDMGSEESFNHLSLNVVQAPTFPYPLPFQQPNNLSYFQPPQVGLRPTFPTNQVAYNGGFTPGFAPTFQPYNAAQFQTLPSYTPALSSTSGPSTSLQGALTPSPAPLLQKKVRKANPKSKSKSRRKHVTRNATQTAKGELLISKPKRQRGPNKRPPGTAFSNLLDGLPNEVIEALNKDYKGCCETVNIKDLSTKQKHMFSNRHCKNLPTEYQELVPNFVCPAFIAFNINCRAKAGRYDSAERHYKNCEGFDEINAGNKGALPVAITRSQYTTIHNYRKKLMNIAMGKQATDQSTEEADVVAIRTTLADVFKDGFPDWFPVINLGRKPNGEPNDFGPIVNFTAQLRTNTTSVVPIANQPQLYEPSLFNPEKANECAEAFRAFPLINHEGESNDSDAITVASAQSSTTTLVPLPAANDEQPSFYQPSLFDPETAQVCAEAFKDGFPLINHEDESNVSDAITDPCTPSQSSLMSAPAPVANHEQPSFYQPLFELEGVDQWGPFLTDFPLY